MPVNAAYLAPSWGLFLGSPHACAGVPKMTYTFRHQFRLQESDRLDAESKKSSWPIRPMVVWSCYGRLNEKWENPREAR